jgi:hypothetical protein
MELTRVTVPGAGATGSRIAAFPASTGPKMTLGRLVPDSTDGPAAARTAHRLVEGRAGTPLRN